MRKILVIDDQAGMRRSLAILLTKEGHLVTEAVNGEHAVTFLQKESFDLVITDLKMSPGTGLDILLFMTEKKIGTKCGTHTRQPKTHPNLKPTANPT